MHDFDIHRTWTVRAFASEEKAAILLSDLNHWLDFAKHQHNTRLESLMRAFPATDLSGRWRAINSTKSQSALQLKNSLDPNFKLEETSDINNFKYWVTEVDYIPD